MRHQLLERLQLRQHFEIRTRAAANVEDLRMMTGYLRAVFFSEAGDDATTANMPPVRFLHFVKNRIGVLHHLAWQRPR